jgi:branched-chain amino acid transport system permease protein
MVRSISPERRDLIVALVLLAVAVALPFGIDSRYLMGQLILALFYASIASQWNLLFGFSGIFSLAQMAIFAFGGYVVALLAVYGGWSIWAGLLPAALGAAGFSLVIGLACLRLTGVYVALLTLAIAQAMYFLIVTDTECFVMNGTVCQQITGGAVGFARFGDLGMKQLLKGDWMIGNYAVVATLFALTMLFTWIVIRSPIGLAFRALKDNPGYAVARGVNRFQAQLLVFGISAFFTGLAGGLYVGHFQAVGPGLLSLSTLMFIIAAVVVGGVGTFWGPLLGAFVLVGADEAMREMGEFRNLGLGLIIVFFIVMMPRGLIGTLGELIARYRKPRPDPATTR